MRNKSRFFGVIDHAIHQESTHFAELGTLERFGKNVCPHFVGRAIFEGEFSRFVIVSNVKVFDFDVFCAFGARNIAILCQRQCTHVVQINNVGRNGVALCFEEVMSPKYIAGFVVKANDLTFGGTLGRNFMFVGRTGGGAFTKGEEGTCMTLAVIVCLVGCIHIPFDVCE